MTLLYFQCSHASDHMVYIPSENSEGCAALRAGDPVLAGHMVHDAVSMLSELRGGGASSASQFSTPEVAVAKARIHASAERMCKEQPILPDKSVFGDLAGLGLEYFEPGSTFTPLMDDLLSLPPAGAEPRPLAELLGPTGVDEVATFCVKSLLPTEIRLQRLSASDAPKAYLDPRLRSSRKAYIRLVQRLVSCGVLTYGTVQLCDVGVFSVAKKSGKQRLVVDARRANLCFEEPPGVSLPTSAAFARLELKEGEKLHCTQFDLSDAFYQFEMPPPLRPFFCMPPVKCREVGVFRVDGKRFRPEERSFPQFRAMAMG